MAEKLFIKNRKGQKMCVVVENPEGKQLAIVMHGLGANKDKEPIHCMAKVFSERDFTVITFDTTNTDGESEGKLEDATTTGYYEDLEDVIKWAKTQDFYQKKFFLIGHSLGGICVALYSINHPEDVRALAPISTVVSGRMTLETGRNKEWEEWKKKGYKEYVSVSGKIKKTPWSHYEDRLKYDLMPYVGKIHIPVLMVVGDKDMMTPIEHQKILFDAFDTDKEFHIIKGAIHDYTGEKYIGELKQIFENWIARVTKND